MADDRSGRFALPFLLAGQAQKDVTHNEALTLVDIAMGAVVESVDIATPPLAPTAGQCWIVAAGATGAWAGHAGEIAGWTAGGWRFVAPVVGMQAWVADRDHAIRWDGSGWTDDPVRSDGFYQDGVRVVGAQGAAIAGPTGGSVTDAESRAAINAILAMLRLHGLIATG